MKRALKALMPFFIGGIFGLTIVLASVGLISLLWMENVYSTVHKIIVAPDIETPTSTEGGED